MGFRVIIIIICATIISCGTPKRNTIVLKIIPDKAKYTDSDTVRITVSVKGEGETRLKVNNHIISLKNNTHTILPKDLQMGDNLLVAEYLESGKTISKKYKQFNVLPNNPPQKWSLKVQRKLPHQKDAFTQGLSYYNNLLYESTGQHGQSRLMILDPNTGKMLKSASIPRKYFGEGSTIIGNTIYYITWESGIGWKYDAKTLTKKGEFNYGEHSSEGWGITTVGDELVMSNGSEQLMFFDPQTMNLEYTISVCTNEGEQKNLNELEYDGTYIYANVWMTSNILIISPKTGKVVAMLDCRELLKYEKYSQMQAYKNVLNGIAYNNESKTFFLTGKNWDNIYEVKILPKK